MQTAAQRAASVLGADGAHSAVPRCLGIELDGHRFRTSFVAADVFDLQCWPGDDITRWQSEPALSAWISAIAGPGYARDRLWQSTYPLHRSVTTSYTDVRHRVLLAGEAAHLIPPFGGRRGLNSGIPNAVLAVRVIAEALNAPTVNRPSI